MGYIYIIRNTINDKVYIGQTKNNIHHRFKQHVDSSKNINKTNKLYTAMRTLGVDKFFIELICETEELSEAEKYYINKYSSYLNGYNGNSGGGIGSASNKELINDITYLANIGMTRQEICRQLNLTQETLSKITAKENIKVKSIIDIGFSNSTKIDCYSKELQLIKTFDNIQEAFEYVKQYNLNLKYSNFEYRVKQSCRLGNISYGHRWRLHGEQFETNKYVNIASTSKVVKTYKCPICGKHKDIEANICKECDKRKRRENIPDIQKLHSLLSQYSYEAIGRMYNVTGKTVRKWADSYNLVESQQRDSSGVTCVELNIHFNTFKEAAEYLINNGLTSATNVSTLGYRISQAKKNNTKYQGLNWV